MTAPSESSRRATVRWSAAAARRWWDESPKRWPPSTFWSLVWLSTLIYTPAFDPESGPLPYLVGAAVIAVFVPFHLAVSLREGPLRRWAPWLTTALCVLTVWIDAGASILLVYAAAFAGSHLRRRVAMRWLVALTGLIVVITLLSSIPFPWRFWAFAPSAVLIWVIGLITMEEATEGRTTRFRNAQVEHLATLSERERISRDMHDVLGQTLTGIVVRSQLAQRLTRADAEAGIAEMAEVERMARAALSEVRETVSGWRHVDLDNELDVARDALSAAGVQLTVAREPGLVLTPSAETALGLALREAVTNVVRHARATHCTVALRTVEGRVVLEVADDGIGGEQRDGNGLTGMRERIAALGGDVQRVARGGTAVTVAVPAAVAT